MSGELRSRMLKAACEGCGYVTRQARSWLRAAGPPLCPDTGCTHYGQPLRCPAWEELEAEELAQLEAEVEAWEAQVLTPDYRLLREQDVHIRKPRACSGCPGIAQVGEPMRLRVYVLAGELRHEYTCTACDLSRTPAQKARGTAGRMLAG